MNPRHSRPLVSPPPIAEDLNKSHMSPLWRSFRNIVALHMAVLCSLVLGVALFSCGRGKPLNLLLISVDTLRPDRLGYEKGRPGISPSIDRLAQNGVVFENALSESGWTLPSMATILTGRYPCEHGATDLQRPMDPRLPTLAGILHAHGYSTAGFVSHILLGPGYGFASGFETFDSSVLDVGHPHSVATAAPLTNLVLEFLNVVEEPFFIWVHYFDPHTEYLEHARYETFGSSDTDRYDQEIAHTDYHIGRLLTKLERKKMLGHTAVVFTSDHGEEFGDHGGKFHFTLYDEVLRVPLVIMAPGLNQRTDQQLVDQVDLLPTMLSLLHIEHPGLPGHDVLAPATDENRIVFFERDRPPGWKQRGLRRGWHKLTSIEFADSTEVSAAERARYATVANVIPGVYLYDLLRDPGERISISSGDSINAGELLAELERHFQCSGEKDVREVEIDETLRKQLRSLGYIR